MRAILSVGAIVLFAAVCAAPDAIAFKDMYPPRALATDAPRLERAVRRIFTEGLLPALTRKERNELGQVRFEFPAPDADSQLLNFYAYRRGGEAVVVMPLLSLKQLEDLTTAYAWLQVNGKSLSTIDLYFAMLRHKLVLDFPGERHPDILSALGVPAKAHEQPRVDALSLSLRNEAYAFILLHELGHVLFRHKPYADVTKAEARADELQSDRFALDVMVRTSTPPMGAVLFFQAQVYAMPHPGQYKTEAEWRAYLNEVSTHPLSTDRIALMADTFSGPLAAKRPSEAATWRFIGSGVRGIARILEDVDLQRCIARTAAAAPVDRLRPSERTVGLSECGAPSR